MNNVVRHSGVPSQTKDHRTVSLLCMFMSCSQHSFYFLYNTPQINSALVLPHLFTLNPIFTLNSLPALPLHLLSPFFFFYVSRHAGPAGLQVWAQEPHCANGSHSCVEVWGAAGLRDCAVGERWPPPGTSEKSAGLSTLQHDWKPQER